MRRFLDFLNPLYHLKRLKEDLEVTRRAIKFRKAHNLEDHDILPEELLRGRMQAAFFMSGPFGLISIPLGYWAQRVSNELVGTVVTILVVMVVSSCVYQVIWWSDNHRLYQQYRPGKDRFREFEKDLLPIHWVGIRTGLVLGLFSSFWAAALVLGGLRLILHEKAALLPSNAIILITDFIFVQGPFLRIMGDFFDKHSKKLALKYQSVLSSAN